MPASPPEPLIREYSDVLEVRPILWRVHRTQGEHIRGWNALRTFGPLPSMRYDPQPRPTGEHPDHPMGVLYAATDLATALAEVFQSARTIDIHSFAPRATAWEPLRPLRLLDLTGTWALRNQAANALAQAPRNTCRAWARTIHTTWGDLDGLWAPSTLTARPIAVLWNPASDTFPPNPAFSRPLATPMLLAAIRRIAAQIGYRTAD